MADHQSPLRFAILGSGRGSNAEAILRAWRAGELGAAQPVAIFSDQPQAAILDLGPQFGVAARYLDAGSYKTRFSAEVETEWARTIAATGAQWVVLAGFMRVIKEPLLAAFPRRIINLHPSLLPSFKGLDGIRQSYDYGVRVTGCTVHYVTGELDGGPIIDQCAVRREDDDSYDSLAAKVHAAEHQLLPAVIRRLAEAHAGGQ
jgi:phosphoribosylglycinamide formyltransferase 1